MDRIADRTAIARIEPYRSEPAAGQAIAAAILLAGAAGLTAWAVRTGVQPPWVEAACVPAAAVSSAQDDAAALRIRFAGDAAAARPCVRVRASG